MNLETIAKHFPDRYDRYARLYPSLLVCLPFIVMVVALYGRSLGVLGSTFASIAISFGGLYLLSDIARSRGKLAEKRLWAKWGGAPSTEIMRHADDTVDAHTKGRCHRYLSAQSGVALPDANAEAADGIAADVAYSSACRWLVANTGDAKKFPLLKNDNITYGFRRNAYAVRGFGLVLSLFTLAWICFHQGLGVLMANVSAGPIETWFSAGEWMAGGTALVMLVVWSCFFTEETVRAAGRSYAERLLLVCETLSKPASNGPTRKTNATAPTTSTAPAIVIGQGPNAVKPVRKRASKAKNEAVAAPPTDVLAAGKAGKE